MLYNRIRKVLIKFYVFHIMVYVFLFAKDTEQKLKEQEGIAGMLKNFSQRDGRSPKGRKEITKNRLPCHFRTNEFFCRQTFRQSLSSSLFCCSIAHDSASGTSGRVAKGKLWGDECVLSSNHLMYTI